MTTTVRPSSGPSALLRRLRRPTRPVSRAARSAASSAGWSDLDTTSPAAQSFPALSTPDRLRFSGSAVIVVGLLAVGFVAQFAGVSQISAVRDQQLSVSDFRYQLANATAPVGQTGTDGHLLALGTPVAILEIPSIGLNQVVLEGTSSSVTEGGPGHRRDTPLPGQQGASVLYGRQASNGAPFAHLASLKAGDVIVATTGQGSAKYSVIGVRHEGDPVPKAMASGGGRLTLVSAEGMPFFPDGIVRVDATLTSAAQPTPQTVLDYAALGQEELPMVGDGEAWPFLLLGLILLFGLITLFALSTRFWGRRQTWVVAVPVLLAVGLVAARQTMILLPNLM